MLVKEGNARSSDVDRRLACILAAIAGALNAAAFHNVSALSDHAALGEWLLGMFYQCNKPDTATYPHSLWPFVFLTNIETYEGGRASKRLRKACSGDTAGDTNGTLVGVLEKNGPIEGLGFGHKKAQKTCVFQAYSVFRVGRGDRIRTCDFYVPNVALYQAELHPVGSRVS
jgi:hypothetical protein